METTTAAGPVATDFAAVSDRLLTAARRWPRGGRLYNVSNFGDTNACYADVDEGDERVFFLTLFNDGLSAQYDDLFGAVADRNVQNDNEILRALGQWTSVYRRPSINQSINQSISNF